MTAPTAAHDRVLHLSLPDWRTALKRRVRRPKRPSWWRVFAVLMCVLCGAAAIDNLVASEWLQAAGMLIDTALLWPCATTGKRLTNLPAALIAYALILAGVFT